MPTIEELLAAQRAEREALNGLQRRQSHIGTYTERRNIVGRIRSVEDRLDNLTDAHQRARPKKVGPVTLFGTRKKPAIRGGLECHMDVSTDGRYFSNPAPNIPNNTKTWVRLRISTGQQSPFSTTRTEIPERIDCRWVIPPGWEVRDRYNPTGRMERFVSNPLVVTREFLSAGSGVSKFGVYVDPYHYIDQEDDLPPDTAPVQRTETLALVTAGTYRFYELTSNVLSAYFNHTFNHDTQFLVAEEDVTLYYTDGGTFISVRLVVSGDRAGEYIVIQQPGIVLVEYEPYDT